MEPSFNWILWESSGIGIWLIPLVYGLGSAAIGYALYRILTQLGNVDQRWALLGAILLGLAVASSWQFFTGSPTPSRAAHISCIEATINVTEGSFSRFDELICDMLRDGDLEWSEP